MKFAPGFVIPILSGSFVFAAIYNSDGSIVATDTSQASVQAAVNRASDGDTVVVPVASSTWMSRVCVNNKAITILGAGIGRRLLQAHFQFMPLM
jgi:endonuclease YncB( thermonuclease family)